MGANPTLDAISKLDAIDRLHRLPDTALLPTELAAAFLSKSISSLERMRRNGSGPVYVQDCVEGARGTNQKCHYQKSDLLDWVERNKVRSSKEAARRKCQV